MTDRKSVGALHNRFVDLSVLFEWFESFLIGSFVWGWD